MDFTKHTFQNIWDNQLEVQKDFWLYFTMDGMPYKIGVIVKENSYTAGNVLHKVQIPAEKCPICASSVRWCHPLTKNRDVLLQHLIQHPALRLRWMMEKPYPVKISERR